MITKNQQTTAAMKIGLWVAMVALLGAGCEWSAGGGAAETENGELSSATVEALTHAENTATSPSAGFPAEITGPIHWLHADVSGWAQTATLHASVGGGSINLSYDKAKIWPARATSPTPSGSVLPSSRASRRPSSSLRARISAAIALSAS